MREFRFLYAFVIKTISFWICRRRCFEYRFPLTETKICQEQNVYLKKALKAVQAEVYSARLAAKYLDKVRKNWF